MSLLVSRFLRADSWVGKGDGGAWAGPPGLVREEVLRGAVAQHIGSMLRWAAGTRPVARGHPSFPSARGYPCAPGQLCLAQVPLVGVTVLKHLPEPLPWGVTAAGF